ncbi:MAG: hypothetical protein K8R23_18230 [Chthoniobacter sp.]|nr:hypothetical protein [Chthoniobacter sp.]
MNEAEKIPQQDAIDVRQLARAIRFALVALVLALSYLSLRSSLSIGGFSQIFSDLLDKEQLPSLTLFVLGARPLFVAVSILVPIIALATLFLRGMVLSFYIIGALGFVTIAQFITLYHGLSAPLSQIISTMSSGPTP